MKPLLFTFLILAVATGTYAQYDMSYKALADKAFNNKDYYEAAFYYNKIAAGMQLTKQNEVPFQTVIKKPKKSKPADRLMISYDLAESYRLYQNYLEAEPWYNKVITENADAQYPLARLWYGTCLRANQHFDEAIKQLNQFITGYNSDVKYTDMAKKEISNCRFAIEQYKYPALIEAVKMKAPWNSDGSDYAIVKAQGTYWYTSSRLIKEDKKHLNRIYTANVANSYQPQLISFKNDEDKKELEYGTPAIAPSGKRIYFTRWYKEGSKTLHAIYYSIRDDNGWSAPQKLNANVNAEGYNSIQPFITADGKTLLFSSNKPGGQGGYDIWMSALADDGSPVNSTNPGSIINTPLDEQAPWYDLDSKRLIYSSKGFIGLGGFDFFESMGISGKWTAPQNMGYPMNSAKDDLYYLPESDKPGKFYLSSDRESDCCLDLFEVYDRSYTLTGLVTDCDTHQPLAGATVSLIDSLSKNKIRQLKLGADGKYSFIIKTRRPYNLLLGKEGYFTKSIPVAADGKITRDTLFNAEICLQAFKVGKPIVIKNVLYDFNKATLRPESMAILNGLVKIMNDNPKIKVELSAHTDSVGGDIYNIKLSQQRAQSCVDYIVSKGIPEARIFARGYGKQHPVAPNSLPNGKDNPEGRQLNRRTEFTVLKTE